MMVRQTPTALASREEVTKFNDFHVILRDFHT
jgi:hypothetical protein